MALLHLIHEHTRSTHRWVNFNFPQNIIDFPTCRRVDILSFLPTLSPMHPGIPQRMVFLCSILLLSFSGGFAPGEEPPIIPIGLDAYRQWDRWPYQRIGARAYMRSTYDRTGGNESADASHFLYQESKEFNVTLDVEGAGILYFARYNHWHGSPWHYEVDGTDFIVQETSTADPLHPVPNSVFMPESLFPHPLTWTWSMTKGADLMWVPIPFERSVRMA